MTDAEINALSVLLYGELTEIRAANQSREDRGLAPAYDGHADDNGYAKKLHEELKRRGIL